MTYKIVFTDYDWDSIDIERELLSEIDCEIVEAQTKDEEDLILKCADADALIVQYAPITNRVIENMKKCKVISRYGIGIDTISIDSASKKGIFVCNVSDYCLDEVADHTLSLILALGRKIVPLVNSVREGRWDAVEVSRPVFNFRSLTLGLIGFGKIPKNLYSKVKNLFGKVVVYDPFISEDIKSKYNLNLTNFLNLIRTSDYISIHCPLVEETYHLFSEREFQLMKPTAYIINTSRGSIIDTTSLYNALNTGHISGAALDVLEEEPPGIDNVLIKLDNVLITPHASFYSESSLEDLQYKTALSVLEILKGKRPINVVNKKILANDKTNIDSLKGLEI